MDANEWLGEVRMLQAMQNHNSSIVFLTPPLLRYNSRHRKIAGRSSVRLPLRLGIIFRDLDVVLLDVIAHDFSDCHQLTTIRGILSCAGNVERTAI